MFTILVCGGRDYENRDRVYRTLDELAKQHPEGIRLVHGSAPGADSLAAHWATFNRVPATAVPADWKKYGRAAGPIRNSQMLEMSSPDLCVAFAGGTGTADMVTKCRKAGVEVMEIQK